MINLYYWTIIH